MTTIEAENATSRISRSRPTAIASMFDELSFDILNHKQDVTEDTTALAVNITIGSTMIKISNQN